MNIITSELYNYSIFQTEQNIINNSNYGFIAKPCDLFKLTISHILIHCIENKDIFTESQLETVNILTNKLQYG